MGREGSASPIPRFPPRTPPSQLFPCNFDFRQRSTSRQQGCLGYPQALNIRYIRASNLLMAAQETDEEYFLRSSENWHGMCNLECQRYELTNQESVRGAQGWRLCAGGEVSGSSSSDLRDCLPQPRTKTGLSCGARLWGRGLPWQCHWKQSKTRTAGRGRWQHKVHQRAHCLPHAKPRRARNLALGRADGPRRIGARFLSRDCGIGMRANFQAANVTFPPPRFPLTSWGGEQRVGKAGENRPRKVKSC